MLKASVGRAVRMPTVAELYGATSTTNSQFINDPNLRPERSWTGELSAETELAPASLARLTLLRRADRRTRSIRRRSSTTSPTATSPGCRTSSCIRTRGIEAAFNGSDVLAARPRPDRQRHLHPLLHREERRLRRRPRRHPRQVAAEHSALARHRHRDLAHRPRSGRQAPACATAASSTARSTTATSTASPTWASARTSPPTCALRWRLDAAVDGGARHRQPQQLHLLELPPLSAAKLQRRAEVGPVTLAFRSLRTMNPSFLRAFALVAAAAAPAAALAHVTLPAGGATAGDSYAAAFRVGHACSGARSTTGITVRIPEGFSVQKAEPRPGWTLATAPGSVVLARRLGRNPPCPRPSAPSSSSAARSPRSPARSGSRCCRAATSAAPTGPRCPPPPRPTSPPFRRRGSTCSRPASPRSRCAMPGCASRSRARAAPAPS